MIFGEEREWEDGRGREKGGEGRGYECFFWVGISRGWIDGGGRGGGGGRG